MLCPAFSRSDGVGTACRPRIGRRRAFGRLRFIAPGLGLSEQVAKQVRSELIIVSPYLVPGDEGMRFLGGLRERNVSVRILTNSLPEMARPANSFVLLLSPTNEIGQRHLVWRTLEAGNAVDDEPDATLWKRVQVNLLSLLPLDELL
jgi:phosphatidylserine/phosphatidylglycerophosphate/cardiolipin synthase-like enzyme